MDFYRNNIMEFTDGDKLELLSKLQRSLGEHSVQSLVEFKEIEGVIFAIDFPIASLF